MKDNEVVLWDPAALEDMRGLGLTKWVKAEIYYSANVSLRWPPQANDLDEGSIPRTIYGYRRPITRACRHKLDRSPGEDDSSEEAYAFVLVYRQASPQESLRSPGALFVVKRVWSNDRLAAVIPSLGTLLEGSAAAPAKGTHAGVPDVEVDVDKGVMRAVVVLSDPGERPRSLLGRLIRWGR